MSTWCDEPPPARLLEGIEEFNRGRFFEQHEILEDLWRDEQRPVRLLYQGILQIGVAFHHLRRANYHGVEYMLQRGAMYLSTFPAVCQGVNVEALRQSAARALDAVRALGPQRLAEFDWTLAPRVELVRPRRSS